MSDKTKDVKIGERMFRVRKFPARSGGFVLIKVGALLAPMFSGLDVKKVKKIEDVDTSKVDINKIAQALFQLSQDDYDLIQTEALRVCACQLQAGWTPVLNENGSIGVPDLEDDTMSILWLTVHALAFNLTSFFGGSPLEALAGDLLGMSQSG